MLFDNIQISEGSNVQNLSINTGSSFPSDPNVGEIFYYTGGSFDGEGIYVYDGYDWLIVKTGWQVAPSEASYITQTAHPGIGNAQVLASLPTGVLKNSNGTGVLSVSSVNLGSAEVSGTLAAARFPALLGDVTTTAGSLTTTLANSGVTAGSYSKVTVDAKGRVTAGSNPTDASSLGLTNVVTTDNAATQTVIGPIIGNYASYANPSNAKEFVTKQYVDDRITGLDVKASVRVATVSDISLSGLQTIDGITLVAGDRILVKNQLVPSSNGIYVADAAGWTRAADANTSTEVTSGLYVFVMEGATNGNSGWLLTTADPISVGVTSLSFQQFTGTGQITAGAGLSLTGNIINVGGTTNRISVGADTIDISANYVGQSSITTLGTIGTGTWNAATVAASYGGTGYSSYTVGEILYAGSSNTLSKLAPNTTATNKFLSQVSSSTGWVTLSDADIPGTLTAKTLNGASVWNGGTIGISYGGTGLTAVGASNTLLSSTGTANEYRALSSNSGVAFAFASGSIKIDTPQDLRTTASPTFANITDSGLTANHAVVTNASKQLVSSTATDTQVQWLAGVQRLTRTLPATVGSSVEIGNYNVAGQTNNAVVIDLLYSSATASIAKHYEIVSKNNHTAGAWFMVQPTATTGSDVGNDFDLEIKVTATNTYFRIRKTAGTDSAAMTVVLIDLGANNVFTATSATAVDAPTGTFDVRNVSLTSSVSGVLTVPNGGTGLSSFAAGDIIYASGTYSLTSLAAAASGNVLLAGATPSWGKVGLTTHVTGTLSATNGGTGLSTYAVGDLLYASSASAISKLATTAAGNVLISGTTPSWNKVGLTSHVSGILPLANGGTNANLTAAAGAIAYSNAGGLALTVTGTSGQVLLSQGTSAPTWINQSSLNVGNADTIDSIHASSFLRSDAGTTWASSAAPLVITTPASSIGTATAAVNTLQIVQATANADAFMSFQVTGDYAVHFGLDGSTNDLFVGGWSLGANKYKILHTGNTTGAISAIISSNLTANRALISGTGGKVEVSSVTSTELSKLSGVTGSVPSVDPTTPKNGDIQCDATNGKIFVYLNSAWKQIFPAIYT